MVKMTKAYLLFIGAIFVPALLLAQEKIVFEQADIGYNLLTITKKSVIFQNIAGIVGIPAEINISDYTVHVENKVPFIYSIENKKELLILRNDDICILYGRFGSKEYSSNNISFFWGVSTKYKIQRGLIRPVNIRSTSFLEEGSKQYKPEDMANFILEHPWVEGVVGQGVGERITFSINIFPEKQNRVTGFYIINGYLSFDKPILYLENSRIKKIKVTDLKNGEFRNIGLIDTPNPQLVDTNWIKGDQIQIEILDVYEGTKYEDTCVTGILLKDF